MSLSFLHDPRLQTLSFQARDLLHCIEEALERHQFFDEYGRAPADPVMLCNFLYPLRPEIRHTHVKRWFSELESASLVTVSESGRGLVFVLAHGRPATQLETSPPKVIPVIHNSGVDPPNLVQINSAVAAAAAVNDLDLIFETLKRFFPTLDLMDEHRKYHRKRLAEKKPALAAQSPKHYNPKLLTFVKWCSQAAIPMPAPPMKRNEEPSRPISMPDLDDDQPDLFTETAHKRFLAELEARKLRKQKQQSERK
jgi:hypothetical protein